MKKPLREVIVVVGIATVMLAFAIFFIFRWVDRQEVPVSIDSRNTLRFIASVYPFLPGRCEEKCVVRTIKIANLVALSEYGNKSAIDFSSDIGSGFSLLNAMLNKGALPDLTAEYEISLERLLFFNRMNAFAINFGRRLDGTNILEKTESLLGHAYDEESKVSFRREKFIFLMMQYASGPDLVIKPFEIGAEMSLIEAYQLMASGWALCAIRNDRGADYISQALPFFMDKRMNLIRAVTRNLDAPLIALAEKHAACQSDISNIKTLLRS